MIKNCCGCFFNPWLRIGLLLFQHLVTLLGLPISFPHWQWKAKNTIVRKTFFTYEQCGRFVPEQSSDFFERVRVEKIGSESSKSLSRWKNENSLRENFQNWINVIIMFRFELKPKKRVDKMSLMSKLIAEIFNHRHSNTGTLREKDNVLNLFFVQV